MSRAARGSAAKAPLDDEFRQLSAATVFFHQAVAERLGLSVTDHKCVDLVLREGPQTAGRLADRTGLSTGAVTGVIDRLERAGLVRRAEDPRDRRRVLVEPVAEKLGEALGPLFASLGRSAAELCARYSVAELAVVRDFIVRAREMMEEETRKLRGASAGGIASE